MASAKLLVSDLTKIVGTSEPLRAKLTNASDTPLTGKDIKFTINGVSYTRVTAADGVASLNINLPIGNYPTTVKFEGDSSYSSITRNVTVHVTPKKSVGLLATDFSKNYGEKKAVSVEVYENLGVVPITGKDLKFTINGVTYTRTSNDSGVASLNINLPVGEYRCVVDSPEDSTHQSAQVNFMVRVKADTHMDGTNIVKMEDETVVYQCAVYTVWERVMDCTVTITVNGVTYTRQTDSNGLAKLNIRLPAGEYDIVAEYHGDNLHNPSSVRNHISSKRYMQELTTIRNGVWYPGDNTGFVESHVMVKQWSPEVAKNRKGVVFWDDTGQKFHKDISFTSYEITETDPRVKTAKFTTKEYFDLTSGILWVYISSPYHENFGGKILKVDYDKDKGLYTYQCQDGRRNYLNKFKLVTTNESSSVYDHLRMLLMSPLFPDPNTADANEMNKYVNHKLLSGLRPLDAYNLEQVNIKAQNSYKNKPGESLSYDSAMDKIMNYSHIDGTPVDVYFTPEGVCQIEPINVKTWLKSGFKITHTDLSSYKYGFDTTNILTGVNVQTPQEGFVLKNADNRIFNNESIGLSYYFGGNIGMISPVTKQVEGETSSTGGGSSTGGSSTATGANKGKTVVVGCDRNNGNDWALQDAVVGKLRSAGYNVEQLPVDSNEFANYDWNRSAKGKVGVYIMASSTISIADAMSSPGHGFDYYVFANRDNELGRGSISGWNSKPWGRDSDCNSVCNGWAGLTSAQIVEKMGSRGTMVYGDGNAGMANAVLAAVNGESTTAGSNAGGEKTTTTVVDEVATYNKALEELSKSVRDLLSFEIKLPLNHPMFKEMHTNQFLWTELPREFKLGNLSEIFKIMASYKQNRGVSYVENRWYIEKMVVKCDSNGLFATLTLNVFPSPYSVYSNALRGYRDAYDQAFKQKEEQKEGGTSSGGGAGQARLGNDSTDTDSMACATGRYRGHAGDNENFDNCAKKGYAQQGRKYYDWARQYKSPIELAKALANRFSYEGYSNNEDANAEVTHNNGGTIHCNCYDACRYVKCCFDACGFDCIVVTGSIYEGGHGWNAVKHNGRWYTFDLCYRDTGREWPGTNTLRLANEW